MGLLSGSVNVSRFNVTRSFGEPDFDAARFEEIDPASEIHESRGLLPMGPGAGFRIGDERWAFRVRIDRQRPDATRVRERLRELVRAEEDAGEEVGPTRRRELRRLATEEIVAATSPSTRIIECCLDDDVLYVAATARAPLAVVAGELGRLGMKIVATAPWVRRGEAVESAVDLAAEPEESAVGFQMMRELLGDSTMAIEPDDGRVKLRTRDTRIALSGVVIHDLFHFLEQGADILAARMVAEGVTFDFDVVKYRITNLRVVTEPAEDWKEVLNERLEKISEVFEILDMRYYDLSHPFGE